jgi:hypothetical protein
MYKIRSYISIFLSNKINYNKIYDIFNKINVKHNLKKSTTTIIYKLRKYKTSIYFWFDGKKHETRSFIDLMQNDTWIARMRKLRRLFQSAVSMEYSSRQQDDGPHPRNSIEICVSLVDRWKTWPQTTYAQLTKALLAKWEDCWGGPPGYRLIVHWTWTVPSACITNSRSVFILATCNALAFPFW